MSTGNNNFGRKEMPSLFPPSKFIPRKTPTWVLWFRGGVVTVPLFAFWGSGAWLVFQFLHGNRTVALGLFPLWLAVVGYAMLVLHRAGLVRISISVITTGVLLVAIWFVLRGAL